MHDVLRSENQKGTNGLSMMLLWSPILPCATIEPRTSTQTRSAISDVMSAWSYGGLTCATESDGSAFVVCESVGGGGWRAPRRWGSRAARAPRRSPSHRGPRRRRGRPSSTPRAAGSRRARATPSPARSPPARSREEMRGEVRGRGWEARFSRAPRVREGRARLDAVDVEAHVHGVRPVPRAVERHLDHLWMDKMGNAGREIGEARHATRHSKRPLSIPPCRGRGPRRPPPRRCWCAGRA